MRHLPVIFSCFVDDVSDTGSRRFHARSSALEVLEGVDLSGKTILITGTTSGIGKETARSLALHGAHLVMANRSDNLARALRDHILQEKVCLIDDCLICAI
jgi:WW domain-containing oxidoreductase